MSEADRVGQEDVSAALEALISEIRRRSDERDAERGGARDRMAIAREAYGRTTQQMGNTLSGRGR